MSTVILGLHFGHDASVAVLRDGELLLCFERERSTRLKHCIGLTGADVKTALEVAEVALSDVDYCSITSTQGIEYMFPDASRLSFEIDFSAPSQLSPLVATTSPEALSALGRSRIGDILREQSDHTYVKRLTDQFKQPVPSVPSIEDFMRTAKWDAGNGLSDLIQGAVPTDLETRLMMHLPAKATVLGREVPAFLFSHHFAHASYSFFTSPYRQACVFTQDGSLPGPSGYWSGMIYFGQQNHLYPVAPHYLVAGNLYERVAFALNLGYDTGAGKLMGLAPYGEPVFFEPDFVGNWIDVFPNQYQRHQLMPGWVSDDQNPLLYRWLNHCLNQAESLGYDLGPLADTEQILMPINVDIAASTQKLLEETMMRGVQQAAFLFREQGLESDGLCLSGGTSLNCPTNTLVSEIGPFPKVHVPPAVHDGGLSIGSALATYYNILEQPRRDFGQGPDTLAYLGPSARADSLSAELAHYGERIMARRCKNPALEAASYLAHNAVVAWFEGRSEIGPRALGHRSILASVSDPENWARVNRLKGREAWRPFAPAVLSHDFPKYFEGCPSPTPFMLFTARVKPEVRHLMPAVTHVDGTSRVQTVDSSCGGLFEILNSLAAQGELPLVMNTSFNGPGEPIVQEVHQAVAFLLSTELDALFIDDWCLTRSGSPRGL